MSTSFLTGASLFLSELVDGGTGDSQIRSYLFHSHNLGFSHFNSTFYVQGIFYTYYNGDRLSKAHFLTYQQFYERDWGAVTIEEPYVKNQP